MPHNSEHTVLVAPVSGMVIPIVQVPDPTFAEKMLGDGLAIDPIEETLRAPCDGVITQIHKANHALTIATPSGVEVLMHIGLDTVLLKGQGFTPLAAEGARVKTGDRLIAFDAAHLARHAASVMVLVVVTAGGTIANRPIAAGLVAAGETPILELAPERAGTSGEAAAATGRFSRSSPIVIRNPAGLHARPAAVLVNSAKQFASSVRLEKKDRDVNAKSVSAVMSLEVENGDTVTLVADGPDAEEAIAKLGPLVLGGLGEDVGGASPRRPAAPPPPPRPRSADPDLLLGVSASPGVATGRVFQLRPAVFAVEEKGRGADGEMAALLAAVAAGKKELMSLQDDLKKRADAEKAAIFYAHQELLEDPELLDAARLGIEKGQSAGFAWREAFTGQANALAKLGNELLAGRANDIRDVGGRVLGRLAGVERKAPEVPSNAILIAENLTPSDTAGLDKSKVLGFATTGGGATSHVAILARAAGIPVVAAAEERALEIPDGTVVILDGGKGEIRLNPPPEAVERIHRRREEDARRREAELRDAMLPAVTTDNHRIKVVANIGGVDEAEKVPGLGGEGVGLLRSEFLFLQRADAPSVEEQAGVYAAIAKALGKERDLIVRTLDVGGDKPLAYLPLPSEDNPFLGVRGIRLGLVDKTLMRDQVAAVLAAAPHARLHVMFPMVSTAEELREAKDAVLGAMRDAAVREGDVKIGIMVEVPSAAVLAENLAKEVDFFSIGTNDLTQYALAMDRGNQTLARMADGLHPAVLNLIAMTVAGAHRHGKWVGVCGGLAGEAEAVPLLVGLGVDELSVTVSAVPAVKAMVRALNLGECRALADEALAMLTAKEVRTRVASFQAEGK